jgi:hypothetical protein
MKRYLRLGPEVGSTVSERHVVDIRSAIEWVDELDDATADYRPAAEVTRRRVKDQLGLETTLVEKPDPLLMQSKWVICIED